MSMTDPIADLLTRLRNAQAQGKADIRLPSSKLKVAVLNVLKAEGYVNEVTEETSEKGFKSLLVNLKYYQGKPVITSIDRVSTPGRRVYSPAKEIPMVSNGLGITIVSTSRGVITDTQARAQNVGGEVLCKVF
jgi:small subunit ribosomal protein S8